MYRVLSRPRWTQPGLVRTEQQLLPYFPIFLPENHIEQQKKSINIVSPKKIQEKWEY